MAYKSTSKPNDILRRWLKSKGLATAQFSRDMGYKSNYCYLLTASNPRPITFEVLGRLLLIYGAAGPAEAIAEAMRRQKERK